MGLKLLSPGGIDQKSSDIARDPIKLRNALNVKYNINKEYEKRDGVDVDTSFVANNYVDAVFIKSMSRYFYRSDYAYYHNKVDDAGVIGARIEIPYCTKIPAMENNPLSGAEYLNSYIFTHTDQSYGTFKYDGNAIYFAGLPVPDISIVQSGAAVSGYMLSFYDFIDANGIQTFGPSKITQITSDTLALTITTPKSSGFYDGYIIATSYPTILDGSLTLADRTISYSSKSPDIIVGSKVVIRPSVGSISILDESGLSIPGPYSYVILEVESIAAGSIAFKANSFNGKKVDLTAFSSGNILGSMAVRTYYSVSETTGYTSGNVITINSSTTTNSKTVSFNLTGNFLLSDTYDITTSKLRPPKCKYINIYGSQLVCSNVISFFDFNNKENNYTNNDLVMYSDISTGDLGENFSELNRQLIGNTYDGQITAGIRAKDSFIVFKDRSVYALDGVLVNGQYSIRKIETNEIGCLSEKSVISVDGTVIFHGQDGLYAINGITCKKVSDALDPFLATTDPSKTRAIIDNVNDQYLFFTDKGVVVYNFMYKEWFIWDLKNADKGLTIDNNRSIRMFHGTEVDKFITQKNDYGLDPIEAYIKTAWFDLGEPSLLKKIVDIRIFSIKNKGQTLKARLYHDWDETKVKSDLSISMPISKKTILRQVDTQQAQSFSFFIGNDVINEDLDISGFEIGCGLIQDKDKNV